VQLRALIELTIVAKRGQKFASFLPEVSLGATVQMLGKIKRWPLQWQTTTTIEDLSERQNPALPGWRIYYGSIHPSAIARVFHQADRKLAYWGRGKHARVAGHSRGGFYWLGRFARRQPEFSIRWQVLCSPAEAEAV
jgi:hypothetical protein